MSSWYALRLSWIAGPPLPTPPGNVCTQVGNVSEVMHGFSIAFLKWFAQAPFVVAPIAVDSRATDGAGRAAADVVVLVLAQRDDRLVVGDRVCRRRGMASPDCPG